MENNSFEYKTVKLLGEGVSAKVYLIEDKKNKRFAMKEYEKSYLSDQYFFTLFESEIKIMNQLSELNNPNIVRLYKILNTGNHYYVLMEYCPDGTLDDYIRKKGKLQEKEAVFILTEILNGLKGLHQLKIIHRDIKAENILRKGNVYKIADFGFSKQNITDQSMMIKSAVIGTAAYISPELLIESNDLYSSKVDLWAVGVLYFYMIFNKLPYYFEGFAPAPSSFQNKFLYSVKTVNDFNEVVNKIMSFVREKMEKGELSKESFNLFEKVFQVDPKRRISWSELNKHPLICKYNNDEDESDDYEDIEIPDERIEGKELVVNSKIFKRKENSKEWMIQSGKIKNIYPNIEEIDSPLLIKKINNLSPLKPPLRLNSKNYSFLTNNSPNSSKRNSPKRNSPKRHSPKSSKRNSRNSSKRNSRNSSKKKSFNTKEIDSPTKKKSKFNITLIDIKNEEFEEIKNGYSSNSNSFDTNENDSNSRKFSKSKSFNTKEIDSTPKRKSKFKLDKEKEEFEEIKNKYLNEKRNIIFYKFVIEKIENLSKHIEKIYDIKLLYLLAKKTSLKYNKLNDSIIEKKNIFNFTNWNQFLNSNEFKELLIKISKNFQEIVKIKEKISIKAVKILTKEDWEYVYSLENEKKIEESLYSLLQKNREKVKKEVVGKKLANYFELQLYNLLILYILVLPNESNAQILEKKIESLCDDEIENEIENEIISMEIKHGLE